MDGGEYEGSAPAPRYDRCSLGTAQAASARGEKAIEAGPGQPAVCRRCVLDLAHRRSLARFAPDYGDWKDTHRRFSRWRDRAVWAGLLEEVMNDPDFEWLMIDASYIKAHPHSAGARGGNQSIARTKGG